MTSLNINPQIIFDQRWQMPAISTVNPFTTLGDFNGDGLIDVALSMQDSKSTTNDLHLLLAKNDGSFVDGTNLIKQIVPTYQTSNILSVDLNKDGFTDLIIGRSGGDKDTTDGLYGDTQLIYLSDGSSGYKPIQSTASIYAHNVMIRDISGDGYVDSFFFATGLGPSILAINQTKNDGSFLFTSQGLPDLAINSSTVESWEILERYSDGWIKTARCYHQHNTAFNDVNRDGSLDMVMFFSGSPNGRIYLNSGGAIPNFDSSNYLTFNSVLQGFPSSGNHIYFDHIVGTNTGTLRHTQQGTNYYETIQFDVNNDGWADVIAVATYVNSDYIDKNGDWIYQNGTDGFNHGVMYQTLINNGYGLTDETQQRIVQPNVNFKTSYHYGQYSMLSVVDLNGDGYLDFTSEQNSTINYGKPNWAGDPDTIFMFNDGQGHFQPVQLAGMEYGSFDPVPIEGKVGFIASTVPTDHQWDLPGFPPRDYLEVRFIKTNVPWTIGDENNNHLYGTVANDFIDGGAGIDTYHAMGRSGDYSIKVDSSGNKIIDLSGLYGTDSLANVQRIKFYNLTIAIDLDGNAGKVAKVLGAVFGKTALTNKEYVGIGLDLIDGGMGYQDLAALAVSVTKKTTSTDICTLLWTNMFGKAPTTADIAPFKQMLDSGEISVGALTTLAADTSYNTINIDLVGLSQTGIEYI